MAKSPATYQLAFSTPPPPYLPSPSLPPPTRMNHSVKVSDMTLSSHTGHSSCGSYMASAGEPCSGNQDRFLLHTRHFLHDTERSHCPRDPQSATRQTKTPRHRSPHFSRLWSVICTYEKNDILTETLGQKNFL